LIDNLNYLNIFNLIISANHWAKIKNKKYNKIDAYFLKNITKKTPKKGCINKNRTRYGVKNLMT
jgi:hypothetical protein